MSSNNSMKNINIQLNTRKQEIEKETVRLVEKKKKLNRKREILNIKTSMVKKVVPYTFNNDSSTKDKEALLKQWSNSLQGETFLLETEEKILNSPLPQNIKRELIEQLERSDDQKTQVAAVLIEKVDNGEWKIISKGYNNIVIDGDGIDWFKLVKYPFIVHAEQMCIRDYWKKETSFENENNLALVVTHSPCVDCSRLITETGIKHVMYLTQYISLNPKEDEIAIKKMFKHNNVTTYNDWNEVNKAISFKQRK